MPAAAVAVVGRIAAVSRVERHSRVVQICPWYGSKCALVRCAIVYRLDRKGDRSYLGVLKLGVSLELHSSTPSARKGEVARVLWRI